ncbi:MAG TPA: response regulator transcription factor [Candidatus Saccharimonadales bacterium]|nr:response regulator transcription factor [Candidatus Saccharimonadales bacterium]
MKLLYIDDNRLLTESVKKNLQASYTVDIEHTGREGIEKAQTVAYSAILLDLGLPDINGLEVCKALRKAGVAVPILVLTIQKDPLTAVNLLNSGADDYLTKPFNGDVLKARIAALLRRSQEFQQEKVIQIEDLKVNVSRRQVWRSGIKISLRRKEFDILEYLATNRGRILTRAMILDHVWESGTEGWNNTVDVHIKLLRDKVDRPFGKSLIKTAYGVGYTLGDTP